MLNSLATDDNDTRLTANQYLMVRQIIINNFIGGTFFGLGTIIGASLLLSVLLGVLRFIDFVPILGDFVAKIVNVVEHSR